MKFKLEQPSLFENSQPTEMTIVGNELDATITRLRGRGAFVAGVVTPRNGIYKLRIHWPQPEQTQINLCS